MVWSGLVWAGMVWYGQDRERSGSVVECLTRDRRAAGSSLIGVTALWSLSKTHLSKPSNGSTKEDPSWLTERLLMGRKESNQTNGIVRYGQVLYCIVWYCMVWHCMVWYNIVWHGMVWYGKI